MLIPFLGLDHLIPDAIPTPQESYAVPKVTADMNKAWQERCGCNVE